MWGAWQKAGALAQTSCGTPTCIECVSQCLILTELLSAVFPSQSQT